MSEDSHIKSRRADKTIVSIIIAIICVAVLNAGISALMAQNVQNRFENAAKQQQAQGKVVFNNICLTLNSLHADQPPVGAGPSDPSRAYLQELHFRLGELATDLKCN